MIVINNKILIKYNNSNKIKKHILEYKQKIDIDTKNINVNQFSVNDTIYLESGCSVDFLFNLKVSAKNKDQLICEIIPCEHMKELY